MGTPLIFSLPLTFTDWLLRDRSLDNGPEGIYQVLSRCKDFGPSKIYWRAFDAGRATVVDYGCEQPNMARFKELYGEDPFDVSNGDEHWIRCWAEPVTQFMREVRELAGRHASSRWRSWSFNKENAIDHVTMFLKIICTNDRVILGFNCPY
ncbi:hypothetical protein [Paenibacillus eucommiae]|uniref:Uncharacterized protein n=1 Tax=Paenibacillus eucommiae TaxID=1355755 RepID=A0ABS4ITD9_9BACL|nr:hypothetical protein [Paenibacillus eucommiae]MBP1990837.1 hypothetical protein [Paenibacillus eucommiae]